MSLNGVKSASRVLDLLEIFAAAPSPLGVSELARRLSIPKSSVSALLRTLLLRGYLERDQHGGYRQSTHPAMALSSPSLARLVTVARPVMAAVVRRCGETAFLGVLTPDGRVQYIDKIVSHREVRYDADIATPRPAHLTATGRVLVAFSSPTQAAHRRAALAASPSQRAFVRYIERARQDGHATNIDGAVIGAAGVAAPIFGADGACVAALNISGPTWRFDATREGMTKAVRWGATEISRLLRRHAPTAATHINLTRRGKHG